MGNPIRSDRVGWGRNRDLGTWRDDRFVRCSRCGWICHLDRDSRSKEGDRRGWGVNFVTTTDNQRWFQDGWFQDFGWFGLQGGREVDPLVVGGCPQCGTYLYDK